MAELTKDMIKEVDINTMDELIDKVNIIDIREKGEIMLSGTLATAKHVPMNELLQYPEEYLNENDEYYILCHSGARSYRTCDELNAMGYKVINIHGGFARYKGENRVDMY
ncbi:rhodanese-like domain-containing protein [uncultured Clostridium sp.]|uniref:rhodanese-like domain-containing protein n=1 Tax=uncultured Clostridium sp. TaxID=59620 RepID=UPI00261AA9B5|nr:rhodanese-like domain-containing protein [uncultured Clostridium sp.]